MCAVGYITDPADATNNSCLLALVNIARHIAHNKVEPRTTISMVCSACCNHLSMNTGDISKNAHSRVMMSRMKKSSLDLEQ